MSSPIFSPTFPPTPVRWFQTQENAFASSPPRLPSQSLTIFVLTFTSPRLGERELVAHNVSKRYLENLRREAWKGRRGSVERGKTYQDNLGPENLENQQREACWKGRRGSVERGKAYQEKNVVPENLQREVWKGRTTSRVEQKTHHQENIATRRESIEGETQNQANGFDREVENPESVDGETKGAGNLGRNLENLETDHALNLPPIYNKKAGLILVLPLAMIFLHHHYQYSGQCRYLGSSTFFNV